MDGFGRLAKVLGIIMVVTAILGFMVGYALS